MSETNNYNFLYGLMVQGIQSYIFATDKLKEFVGASEIIEQLCTTWFSDFLKNKGLTGIKHLNAAGNIRFQTDETMAKQIFEEYHQLLLDKAPGVPFSQAVVKITNGNEYKAIQDLDKKLRGQRNQPMYEMDLGIMTRSKFRRTGDFAWKKNHKVKDNNKFVDKFTFEKYENSEATALTKKISIDNNKYIFPKEFSELTKGGKHSWLAVVHIDGNGMGIQIKKILNKNPKKFEALKEFSNKVGQATVKAFQTAINEIVLPQAGIDNNKSKKEKIILPIRPIILGGDDVTFIIRADLAVKFTEIYLDTFEKETKESGINECKGLTAAAGIAFVKEKFPFHYAADLAEDLCVFAKNISKRKHSCLHFHRVQDSVIDNYKEIINRELTGKNIEGKNIKYVAGPYYLPNVKESNINKLLSQTEILKNEDSPKNSMREYLDVSFGQAEMLSTIWERLKNKTPEVYNNIICNHKAYVDYLTLLAVDTKTKQL